jgi:hypothetical protein
MTKEFQPRMIRHMDDHRVSGHQLDTDETIEPVELATVSDFPQQSPPMCQRCGHAYNATRSEMIDCSCCCHASYRFVCSLPPLPGE